MANIFNYDGSSLLSNQNLAKTQGKNGPMGFIMFLIIHRTGSWTNSPPKKNRGVPAEYAKTGFLVELKRNDEPEIGREKTVGPHCW